ncbi:hypothetical protein WR25_21332 [Diploscapter pachys]|uniref:Uncharacterized protein n=1 Tax=Diploscapter pachys TaxID=2018661 RepID=A0A2A2KC21_9BILA|nr:hypothetical protein WR25_21332 [Diploscapter pachys]
MMPSFRISSPFGPCITTRLRPPGRQAISRASARQGSGQNHSSKRSIIVFQTWATGASICRSTLSSRLIFLSLTKQDDVAFEMPHAGTGGLGIAGRRSRVS